MKNIKILLAFVFFFMQVQVFAQIQVSIPDTTAAQGEEILVPIYTEDITGQNIVSYQFKVMFDESILNAIEIVTAGTLTPSGWFALANTTVDGEVSVAASGATATNGQGVLLYLKFSVIAASGNTDLTFDNFIYNSSTPSVTIVNGSLSIPGIQLQITLPNISSASGDEILVPINTEDITGLNIVSYQLKVMFDETILNAVDIVTSETLTPGGWFAIANTNTDGQISVAASGATATSGEGVLVYLKFQVVGTSGNSDLTFDNFIYNTGSPEVTTTNGSVSVLKNIGWCNLQWPPTITIYKGETSDIYSQVWINNDTQNSGETVNLLAWIGVNSENTDPITWSAQNWARSNFNTDSGNNDEFKYSLPTDLEIGTYYYLSRFQYENQDYFYGGFNSGGGGFWDGTTNVSGILVIRDTILAPTNLTSEISGSSVHLTWTDNSTNESGFKLERKVTGGNNFEVVATFDSNAVEYTDNTVLQSVSYQYRINAFNENTTSDYSNIAEITIPAEEILAPSDVTATQSDDGINLEWTDNSSNESSFVIERSVSTLDDFIKIDTVVANTINYLDASENVESGLGYYYRLFAINDFTTSEFSDTAYVDYLVGIEESDVLPTKYELKQNYPNPFNPSTTISYQIKEPGFVSLKVCDILGKEVATLVQKNEIAGVYNVNFDASKLSSGLYIYRLKVNNFVENKKMLLTK